MVHIPILEMQPNDFNIISSYILNNNEEKISALADFTQ